MKDEDLEKDGLQSGHGVSVESQSSRVVTDNERLFRWLNPEGCWHKWEMCVSGYWCATRCGAVVPNKRKNPDYSTESGFFALLEGLKAKGMFHELYGGPEPKDDDEMAVLFDARCNEICRASAATLPEALYAAALKALDAEPQPTKVDTDAANEKADSTPN